MPQYKQRVDESNFVQNQVLIPGLRGEAYPIRAYEDPLTEDPFGPIAQINNGFNFKYSASRIRSLAPVKPVTNMYSNGKFMGTTSKPYRFKANQVAEINSRTCS